MNTIDNKVMKDDEMVRKTYSICPVCLKKIPASLVQKENGSIWQEKTCEAHGSFQVPVWKGMFDFADWISSETPLSEEENAHCDGDCRACDAHGQGTCCVILEVTKACNLRCTFCFAHGGEDPAMPSTESLKQDIDQIVRLAGDPLLQLSGGEPSLRDDLPELVRYAKEAGCSYTQINTNGIRLAEDEDYVASLAKAGLDIVFLQFDGVDDAIYRALRGQDLLEKKLQAIRNCDKYRIGVTLVPTVVPGINDHALGGIIRLAVELFPAVRSVHFQPVTYLGRYPGGGETGTWSEALLFDRYTLDELMHDLVGQTGIPESALLPSRCDHAACEFHATFIVNDSGHLIPVSDRANDVRTCRTSAAQNRRYVAEHWKRAEGDVACKEAVVEQAGTVERRQKTARPEQTEPLRLGSKEDLDFDTFIRYMKTRTLKISGMAFQDAANLDLERLYRCSLHVYEAGKLLPFCGKYLTPMPE